MSTLNQRRIQLVVRARGHRSTEFMLVGGAAMELYATRSVLEPPRPTEDVDVVVRLASRVAFDELEVYLRSRGFVNDVHSTVLSRYRLDFVQLDVAVVPGEILGFENRWYAAGFEHTWTCEVGEGLSIRLPEAPYLIGMKLEAFFSRGNGDLRTSTDFEDIVVLIHGRVNLLSEAQQALPDIRAYLAERISILLTNEDELREAIDGHLGRDLSLVSSRRVLSILRSITGQ
jgi:predicted nucleotidyltransferase